jgi:hypothetical protein
MTSRRLEPDVWLYLGLALVVIAGVVVVVFEDDAVADNITTLAAAALGIAGTHAGHMASHRRTSRRLDKLLDELRRKRLIDTESDRPPPKTADDHPER